MGSAAGVILRFGPGGFTFLYEHWVGFLTASLLMSIVQANYVYLASFLGGKLLTLNGNSGNIIYDVRTNLGGILFLLITSSHSVVYGAGTQSFHWLV